MPISFGSQRRRTMLRRVLIATLITLSLAFAFFLAAQIAPNDVVAVTRGSAQAPAFDRAISTNNQALIDQGRQVFRYDTFGDEAFWGDTLKLHQAIEGAANGGVGPGVSPKTA